MAFTALVTGVPAYGQNSKSEVEVDLSILKDLPARPQPPLQYTPPPVSAPSEDWAHPGPAPNPPALAPGQAASLAPPQAPEKTPLPAKTVKPVIHKAPAVKKKKPPAPHKHPATAPAKKPQVATAKAPAASAAAPAPATTVAPSIDAPAQNPATPDKKQPAMDIEDISAPTEKPAQAAPPKAPAPIPVIPVPAPVTAPPPDKKIPAGAMEDINAPAQKAAQPAPPTAPVNAAVAPFMAVKPIPTPVAPAAPVTAVPPAVAPVLQKTPTATSVNPVSPQPSAEKQNVPVPPPADSHEASSLTIPFKAGATDQLDSQTTATLQAHVLTQLKEHPTWRVQIKSYASPVDKEPISARRVSLARALAVRQWLLDKGVEARRMDLRALGLETDHEPSDRVDMVFLDPNGG